jgi:glycosyltransferase involved in cell wall biosynthesis
MASAPGGALKILHVFRAPVGGLFRHVVDLARGQVARGHDVGIIADSTTGGARAEDTLREVSKGLSLGLTRVPMSRHVGASDLGAARHVGGRAAESGADVLHGHGAKGGAYARLAASSAIRVYTPHGGSLHYSWNTPAGFLYLAAERVLTARTDLFLFESAYGREVFASKVGRPTGLVRVVHNGVIDAEFMPVAPAAEASDIVFVGELRRLKGVDVLLEAIARLRTQGRPLSATIAGDGPDAAEFRAQAEALGLTGVSFPGAAPARQAFARGRLLVVPSRAESLPYIVLEAAAAAVPMIATRVGGIGEIFGTDEALVRPGDAEALARAIAAALDHPAETRAAAERLRERVRAGFSAQVMTDAVLAAYYDALATRHG